MTSKNLEMAANSEKAVFINQANFAKIDWQAPWLLHLAHGEMLENGVNAMVANNSKNSSIASPNFDSTKIAELLNQALAKINAEKGNAATTFPTAGMTAKPLQFVSQKALPEGEGYEAFIGKSGQIPTRDNLHDLFNGSIWLTFPKTKARLNFHHMQQIRQFGEAQGRGRVRDTITVFDENGAILVTANPDIGNALKAFDWQDCLVNPRADWDNPTAPNATAKAGVYIFGHALLEQLITPRKPLCAHSLIILVEPSFFAKTMREKMAYLDDVLAKAVDDLLTGENVTPKQLSPLPILGVPNFWEENEDKEFYNDSFVFRSGRRK